MLIMLWICIDFDILLVLENFHDFWELSFFKKNQNRSAEKCTNVTA